MTKAKGKDEKALTKPISDAIKALTRQRRIYGLRQRRTKTLYGQ